MQNDGDIWSDEPSPANSRASAPRHPARQMERVPDRGSWIVFAGAGLLWLMAVPLPWIEVNVAVGKQTIALFNQDLVSIGPVSSPITLAIWLLLTILLVVSYSLARADSVPWLVPLLISALSVIALIFGLIAIVVVSGKVAAVAAYGGRIVGLDAAAEVTSGYGLYLSCLSLMVYSVGSWFGLQGA